MADLVRHKDEKAEGSAAEIITESEDAIKGRKSSRGNLFRTDSLHLEAGRVSKTQGHGSKGGWETTLLLAFQSIGVVYGDIGTSPLYVYSSTFTKGIKEEEDIFGVLSLIMYTIILIPLIKYVFVVLLANDNGDGGTFALYSLICRHAKVSLIPNQQSEDAMLSNYKLEIPTTQVKRAHWIKEKMENSKVAKYILFIVTILATSMVIGDGVLTPCISVLSAVSGIKQKAPSLTEGSIAIISIVILILIFAVQRFGTDKVGYTFAPIIMLWFSLIGGIGIYNLFKYNVGILRAFNPNYIVQYFKRNGKQGWISLGGIVLCITGTEAMFADLGHFNIRAIQISFTAILFPSVSLAYIGQAAYLTKYPDQVSETFYKSIPGSLFWLTFLVAVAAAIIASQAMISGAFSIISQSQSLGCFPRIKVVHTSNKYEGQVYIPEINYALMLACVLVTGIFKNTEKIGNAYGIAVVFVMLITTFVLTLVMLFIWKTSILWIALFFLVFSAVETLYLSSVLYKFTDGGFLPLLFACILMVIMGVWHYAHVERYKFELKNKVSASYVRDLAQRRDVRRIPGIGLLYSELVQGIPPIFQHFVDKIPSIHSVLVFVSIKYLPISKVEAEERFLFREIEPRECRMYKCVVRYGYNDPREETKAFESSLIESLKEFVQKEGFVVNEGSRINSTRSMRMGSSTVHVEEHVDQLISQAGLGNDRSSTRSSEGAINTVAPVLQGSKDDQAVFIQKEMEKGVVYLLGETEVVASHESGFIKKVIINYMYYFLRRNFRQGEKVMSVPHSRLLRVGMVYEI